MTKVLHLLGAGERGGAEAALLALTRRLPALGVEPVIVALADGPFLTELERAEVTVVRTGLESRAREVWRLPAAVRAIAAIARDQGADVVQGNGEKMSLLAAWSARRIGRPGIAWLHDAPTRDIPSAVLQAALRTSPVAAAIVPSRWMQTGFRRRWRLTTELIPYGIEPEAPAAPAALRQEQGWADDAVVVTHVGRLQRWKGADVFLRAGARVARARPDVRLVVVGGALYGRERAYADSLPALADSLGMRDRVAFTGHRDDVRSLMAASDVVVHASTRPEPFGLVVAEAMLLGKPVVATRTGGPEEQVDDMRTGLLVAPGDETELAAAIERLAGDAELRAQLGDQARPRARDTWSADLMAKRFAALYERVTSTVGTRSA